MISVKIFSVHYGGSPQSSYWMWNIGMSVVQSKFYMFLVLSYLLLIYGFESPLHPDLQAYISCWCKYVLFKSIPQIMFVPIDALNTSGFYVMDVGIVGNSWPQQYYLWMRTLIYKIMNILTFGIVQYSDRSD